MTSSSAAPATTVVDGNRGNDVALLGAGADHFQWDPGDGSDTVEGQGGQDVMDFNGSNAAEHIDVSANGAARAAHARRRRHHHGLRRDRGPERPRRSAAPTPSPSTTSAAPTSTAADVDLGAFDGTGDGAADTVIANATDAADDVAVSSDAGTDIVSRAATKVTVTGGEPALDNVIVATLGGDDNRDRRRRLRRKRSCHGRRWRGLGHHLLQRHQRRRHHRHRAQRHRRRRVRARGRRWSTTAPSRTSSSAASPARTPSTARTASARSPT